MSNDQFIEFGSSYRVLYFFFYFSQLQNANKKLNK